MRLALDEADFVELPRHPAYRYRYHAGEVWITPLPRFYHCRLDLARHYDRVVVLDAGKVAEVGTYQELTTRDGLFQHLLAQAGLKP